MENKFDIIQELKKKHNAIILAHNYQPAEIQDIADFTGDSLELSRKAAFTDADVIIFCGVDFMAETAKILSPQKKVVFPAPYATCPMAEMITAQDLLEFKEKYSGVPVITYVNSTAEVKAVSDICCTSSNAIKIAESVKGNDIIFTPDENLAKYVAARVDKNIIPWHGFCPVHDGLRVDDVRKAKEQFPDAVFMAHPECRSEVLDLADYIVSTGQMFDVVQKDQRGIFLIGTEEGIIYSLRQRFPEKEFIPLKRPTICHNMKKMTIDKVVESLRTLLPEVYLPEEIICKASSALKRMLDIS